jgi:hypothetical protein
MEQNSRIATSDIKKKDFRDYYIKNRKEKAVSIPQYNAFTSDLLKRLATAIVTEGIEVKFNKAGKIRVKSEMMPVLNKEGEFNKRRPDWQKTKAYWKVKYPGLTPEELKALPKKTIIYHENDHTDGEHYRHYWDKTTSTLIRVGLYRFRAARQFSRLINKVVTEKNRKVFYYG